MDNDSLNLIHDFEVTRPREVYSNFGDVVDIASGVSMPDHSLPTWAVHGTHADVQEPCENQCTGTSISFMKYDLENIPDDFL